MSVTAQGHRNDGLNDFLSKVFDPACTILGYRCSGKEAQKRLKLGQLVPDRPARFVAAARKLRRD